MPSPVAPILSDQGRIARHGGSVALRERLVVLFDEMRRTNADIAALWEIFDRARRNEEAAEKCTGR